MSRKPKRAKVAKGRKKLSVAQRFALASENKMLAEKLARVERERDEANARLYEIQERLAMKEEVPFGTTTESVAQRAERILVRNNEWIQRGGKVQEAYILPLNTGFGPLELPLWQDAGIKLTDAKARELAELFKLDRRDIYSIYFSP